MLASGGGGSGPLWPEIWILPLGGEARKLRSAALAASVSPDGSQIVYVDARPAGTAISVMSATGEDARVVAPLGEKAFVNSLQWSPNGQRIAYLRGKFGGAEITLETRDVKGGPATVVLTDDRLSTHVWLPDGRIVYALKESFAEDEANLWQLAVDPDSGGAADKPSRITKWSGLDITELSVTADGKRLVFLQRRRQADVYAAELEPEGAGLKPPQQLTLNQRDDFPSAWTGDSRALLVHSNRAGNYDVFQHPLDGKEKDETTIVSGAEEQTSASLSADGAWILYWSYPTPGEIPPPSKRLLRVPPSGGAPQVVLEAGWKGEFRCPSVAGADCVLSEEDQGKKQLVFTAFSPTGGRKVALARINVAEALFPPWDLAFDGSRIVMAFPNKIQVISATGEAVQTVPVLGFLPFTSVAWSANGRSLFATRFLGRGFALVQMDLDGQTRILLQREKGLLGRPVPSPDGRYLALSIRHLERNAWMIDTTE